MARIFTVGVGLLAVIAGLLGWLAFRPPAPPVLIRETVELRDDAEIGRQREEIEFLKSVRKTLIAENDAQRRKLDRREAWDRRYKEWFYRTGGRPPDMPCPD